MAAAAKLELTQQIFTKTMTVQVWKPEHERPGRHFVYTGRYVCFFIQILYHMSDRVSLEALAKRIRKKAGDFVEHSRIWQELCMAYLKAYKPFLNGLRIVGANAFLFTSSSAPSVLFRKATKTRFISLFPTIFLSSTLPALNLGRHPPLLLLFLIFSAKLSSSRN